MALCMAAQINADDVIRPKRIYDATRIHQPVPVIDGLLTDSVWLSPEGWQGDFTQYSPNEGQPATRKTRFKITYDNANIYVAIMCYDEPGKVRKILTPRDQSDNVGDLCGVAFDSYFNHVTAYEFDVTAAGQQIDVMYIRGGNNYDWNWNAIWESATAVNDSGWAAEFRIPFSQLRYHNIKEQVWGLHVWRVIDRLNEQTMWNLMPSTAYPGSHNFGELHGISGIRSSRQTELLPYVSLKYDNNNQNDNPYVKNGKLESNAGVDAKIGISSNFTLDATINPDFGQIEQDPAILNLTAFETYFDEKRPFFLEGNDIFDFSVLDNQLFYSRRLGAAPEYGPSVGDNQKYQQPENTTILGSGKLTGRTQHGLSVGILETVTKSEYGKMYSFDSATGSVDTRNIMTAPYTNYLSARVKKESADANTEIGGSFNSVAREFAGDSLRNQQVSSAHTAALDFKQMFLDKNYYVKANAMGSYLAGSQKAISSRQESAIHEYQRPDAGYLRLDTAATSLSGDGGLLQVGKQGGVFQFWANGSFWSPGLDLNDVGYLKATDIVDQQLVFFVNDNTPIGLFKSIYWYLVNDNSWTFGREHTQSMLETDFYGALKNLWEIDFQAQHFFPSLDARMLRGGPALYQDSRSGGFLAIMTDQTRRVSGTVRSTGYFNIGAAYATIAIDCKLNVNPFDKLTLSADADFEKNNLPYDYFNAALPAGINVVGRLRQEIASLTLRAEFYVNPRLSLRYYGNPYFTSVDFSDFRRVANPHAANVDERFHSYTNGELSFDASSNAFTVNEGGIPSYSFSNPDEFYGVFQSNFVFRWEYQPGSTFYAVWTHNQGKDAFYDAPRVDENSLDVFKTASRDVFMVKLSYWFSL